MFAFRLFYQRYRKAIMRLGAMSAIGAAVFAFTMPAPRADAAALTPPIAPKLEIVRAGALSPLLSHQGFEHSAVSLHFRPAQAVF